MQRPDARTQCRYKGVLPLEYTQPDSFLDNASRLPEALDEKSPEYDKQYIVDAIQNLTDLLEKGLTEKYGVSIGSDLEFTSPDKYLSEYETLYEFLFIR